MCYILFYKKMLYIENLNIFVLLNMCDNLMHSLCPHFVTNYSKDVTKALSRVKQKESGLFRKLFLWRCVEDKFSRSTTGWNGGKHLESNNHSVVFNSQPSPDKAVAAAEWMVLNVWLLELITHNCWNMLQGHTHIKHTYNKTCNF